MSLGAEVDIEVHEDPAHWRYFDITAGLVLLGHAAIVYGYSLKNPSGAATAAIDIYDATDAVSAQQVFTLTFAASESLGDSWGSRGILFKNGVYANVTSGEVKGSIFYRHYRR